MAHPSAVQTAPVSMSAQIATMNDVANMPTKNCGRYIVAPHPLKEPAAPFAKRLNGVDPYAYIANVLERIVDRHPVNRLDELLPWAWKAGNPVKS